MGKITLDGMEFFAYHGCIREEELTGTRFIVDLSVISDTSVAEKSDHLADTVNYLNLYQLVKTEMEFRSNLLEHLGHRILNSIKDKFPEITAIDLRISKLNPPVGGKAGSVSFSISWNKKSLE